MIEIDGLTIRFGRRTVVEDIGFTLEPGRCVALVGESGAGKSLSARAAIGLVPEEATVHATTLRIGDRELRAADDRAWQHVRGRTVALVTQDSQNALDPLRRVGDEIAEPLRIHEPGLTVDERRERVLELMTRVGIPAPGTRALQFPGELSGGLRQRALIASALAAEPSFIIADEPTTALDTITRRLVLDLLAARKREGIGLLVVSHDLGVVAELADEVLVLRDGRVVERGAADDVLRAPAHEETRALLAAVPDGRRITVHDVADAVDDPASGADDTTSDTEPVLVARGLRKGYALPGGGAVDAVADVYLELRRGTTLGVVGESGSGKSTLARLLLAIEEPDAGTVHLGGEPWLGRLGAADVGTATSGRGQGRGRVRAVRERDRHRRRGAIQLVQQDAFGSFDPRWTVRRIVRESPARPDDRRIDELLRLVDLDPALGSRRPWQLSGGQRQRVAIARAIASDPSVLVADEPVSALDATVQRTVLELFVRLRERLGVAIVFISHDLGVVESISDEILVMQDGEVVERGPVDRVVGAPEHEFTRRLLAARSTELGVPSRVCVPGE
ncbi:peptide/nickel transport system ATP-binding protein [Pseudoclavibacter chungangensis]|uniref:ATP-binding cassette domain-containing protein n=1 Tax=Pseudoclavibacter chungangensis TaxID=587635 RepID=UPI0015CD960E|nr:ABC transporter ATP-binding protein [Pseudoclavibacter chungangensis]NYJ68712.1 peptide/nickel transport system ATP-binding protein [Pseudoclavibacter chungangensis]